MNCWHCKDELIWGSDSEVPEQLEHEEFDFITFLSCPTCQSQVEVWHHRETGSV
jgi:uncharacterized protein with PIN domain